MIHPPQGLKFVELTDSGRPYWLAFLTEKSEYDDWIAHVGGPDDNARLLMVLLAGSGTLVDVGANIGTITVPVALRGSDVIAVELLPANCLRLWAAAIRNDLHHVNIVGAAAGDYDGTIGYQGFEASGNVYPDADGPSAVCLRLDTILTHYSSLVGDDLILKIDVEGHEPAVLRGATDTITRWRPTILFESIEIEGGPTSNGMKARLFLADQGYDLFLTRGEILSPRMPADLQEGHVVDYLAIPKERQLDLTAFGYEVRQLTDNERLMWVDEMASFPMLYHREHAANVLLRWERESPYLAEKASEIAQKLMDVEELSKCHDSLRRLSGKLGGHGTLR